MRIFNAANPPSLRTPYLVFSVLLSAVVSLFALSNYQAASIAYSATQGRLQQVDSRAHHVGVLQRNLNTIYRSIDLYLLDPDQHEHRATFHHQIAGSIEEVRQYIALFGDAGRDHPTLHTLIQLFQQLGQEADELFAIRVDSTRQHPALAISSQEMTPHQTQVTDALGLLAFQIESGAFSPRSPSLYPQLLKTSLQWSGLISQMRIYFANRLGSFAPGIIAAQEESARDLFLSFQGHLSELIRLYAAEPESFEGPSSTQAAAQAAEIWFELLEEVFRVNRSDRWREDSYRMEYTIIPLFELMDGALDQLRTQIAVEKNEAIEAFNQSSRGQLTAQAVIIALFVLFLVLLLSSLELLVFRPLSQVAATLRRRAFNEGSPEFPAIRSREMQQLIDAFREMDTIIQASHASLQASEHRLREIAENIREVVWVGSTDWQRFTYVSPYYETMFGRPCHSLYDHPASWFEAIHPEDREAILEVVEARATGIISTPSFPDYRICLPDGEIKWVSSRAYRVIDKTTGQPKIIGILADITKQKINEEALLRTQKLNAMRQLTGGIAHDFNNILGVILGFSELIERRLQNPDKIAGYAGQIQRACERARRLTSKLLVFSRREASSAAQATDINAMLVEEQPILEKTLTARVRLDYGLAPDLWSVWLDAATLGDAILNMAINALHAMPEGGELRISTANVHLTQADVQQFNVLPGDYVLLAITDTGTGMDRETLQRVFEPFFTTKGEGGTGLGMSQVYGFVQQSKGAIQVYSEPGHGTRIGIFFPRHRPAADAITPPVADHPTVEPRGHERILVVDDEPALREFFQEVLGDQGYQVQCAQDGREALELLERSAFDLMLSDVVMPGMDGYQLADRVRQRVPTLRIQLISGFSDRQPTDAAGEALFHRRLHKPLSAGVLLARVRRVLDEDETTTAHDEASDHDRERAAEWAQALSTGIPEIDDEHALLIHQLTRCLELKHSGGNPQALKDPLDELVRFAAEHFRREEAIMEAHQVPGLADHKEAHLLLAKGMEQTVADYAAGRLDVDTLLEHIVAWIRNHVLTMDSSAAPHLREGEGPSRE